jgi:hypothetical protein
MMQRPRFVLGAHLALATVIALLVWVAPQPVAAQIAQGATMTVLQGQVAVVRGDGSAIQPAPSGTIVNVGDEIRTLSKGGALVTFFSGTEIEMGEDTVLAVDNIDKSGDNVNISLRQVFGASIHRVQTLTGSDSTYRVEAGGAVALVRGTTFAIVGPFPSSVGDLVVLVCLEDCGSESGFAGCTLSANSAFGVAVGGGQVQSACEVFGVKQNGGFYDTADEALTSLEQMLGSPNGGNDEDDPEDKNDPPNNQSNDHDDEEEEEEDDDHDY